MAQIELDSSQFAEQLTGAQRLRVGLIADTHMPGTVAQLWSQVHDLFRDVDCILHAGDLHTTAVIEELATIAPTYVSRGNGDSDVEHGALKDTWRGDLAGVDVGLVHHLPNPSRADETKLSKRLNRHFGEIAPRLVVYGHTHLAEIHEVGATIYVNPGSATLPNNQSTRLGTVGLLDIMGGQFELRVMQLVDHGAEVLYLHS